MELLASALLKVTRAGAVVVTPTEFGTVVIVGLNAGKFVQVLARSKLAQGWTRASPSRVPVADRSAAWRPGGKARSHNDPRSPPLRVSSAATTGSGQGVSHRPREPAPLRLSTGCSRAPAPLHEPDPVGPRDLPRGRRGLGFLGVSLLVENPALPPQDGQLAGSVSFRFFEIEGGGGPVLMLEFQNSPPIPEIAAQRLFRQALVQSRHQRGVRAMGGGRNDRSDHHSEKSEYPTSPSEKWASRKLCHQWLHEVAK